MDRKIIGFDGKRAAGNRSGLGNYSRYVIGLLMRYAPGNEYVVYVPDGRKRGYLGELGEEGYSVAAPRTVVGRWLRALWRTVGIVVELRRRGVDLYHGLSNELPLGIRRAGCLSVVTVHDVIFLHCPEYYKPVDRWIYKLKMRYACRVADCVVTVSEFSRGELVRYLHVDPGKIKVVYQGITMNFGAVGADDVARVRGEYGLPERYVLYVGTVEERKNLLLVARAMVLLKGEGRLPEGMRVVAAGRRTRYAEVVEGCLAAAGLGDRLQVVEGVPMGDLAAFYRGADFFVYPSRIEGFGIPMLEAAAAGLPAVGCTGSSLEEAGGEGAFYVEPDDVAGMAEVLLRLWNDADLRKERSAMGRAHAERFSDRRLFDDLTAVYEGLI